MEQALKTLLDQGGALGAIVILGGWLVVSLHRQLTDVQEKRIADAQAVGNQMLSIVKDTTEQRTKLIEVLTLNNEHLRSNTEVVEEMRRRLKI